jgi:ubiquinone/menaquinone biosynthesis C-methylase UbiE
MEPALGVNIQVKSVNKHIDKGMFMPQKLRLLSAEKYKGVNQYDPIKYYYWPVFGHMYRRRVELALEECTGGERVLEVGFGTGLAFPNLNDAYKEIHGIDLTVDIKAIKSVFEPLNIQLFLKRGDVLKMPYDDNFFDTVLLVSILEHLKPIELEQAFVEVRRVLKPGGQMVYGTPVEKPFMVFMFRMLGHNIREEHFSTEKEISTAAHKAFSKGHVIQMKSAPPIAGAVYEVGNFIK